MNRLFKDISEFFSDIEDPSAPKYDPVHIGAMLVIVLFANTVLFWLLWSLLVFGGGLQSKIAPLLSVLFTSKTAADFGYIAYPYAMGVFEGWITNLTAFVIFLGALAALWRVFNNGNDEKK